jgi:hypothetical protein
MTLATDESNATDEWKDHFKNKNVGKGEGPNISDGSKNLVSYIVIICYN